MKKFDSILKTKESKKKYYVSLSKFFKKSQGDSNQKIDYAYYENLYIQNLLELNSKKKFDTDLIFLWGQLEMKSYIDYELCTTINPYLTNMNNIRIKDLPDYNYFPEDTKIKNILDISYLKSISLEGLTFNNVYIVVFEIMDFDFMYRPYVLLFSKDNSGKFVEIGFGYDTNNDGNVELFISSFNYPIYLNSKGFFILPLANKRINLEFYDYITSEDVGKLLNKKIK